MKLRIYHYISDGGDGSYSLTLCKTQAEVDKLKAQDEKWSGYSADQNGDYYTDIDPRDYEVLL